MKPTRRPIGGHRHLELRPERVHDPYMARAKLASPSVCSRCGLVYEEGRWRHGTATKAAHAAICPACHRIADRLPAGHLRIEGDFAQSHREEVMHLLTNTARHVEDEHPLERVMAIESDDDGLSVTTTGIHVARGLGEALARAYRGELDYRYNEAEPLLRVRWVRNG